MRLSTAIVIRGSLNRTFYGIEKVSAHLALVIVRVLIVPFMELKGR